MSTKKSLLLGAHMSIAGGMYKSILRAESIGCTTMQIFTKSNKTWAAKKITDEEANIFKETLKKSNLSKIMVHAAYLINLGAKNPSVKKKSITALTKEILRCEQLDIPYLVLHPGAHLGSGEEKCIEQIAEGLDISFEKAPGKCKILLETAAGQGTNVGYTFDQIKQIYNKCSQKKRLGVCFDTCHVFAAGYDISSKKGYDATWKEFEKKIGKRLLCAIHLNDSKGQLGSRIDRHEKIGKGHIPLTTFKRLLQDPRFKNIPKVLETPIIQDPLKEYAAEIKLIQKIL